MVAICPLLNFFPENKNDILAILVNSSLRILVNPFYPQIFLPDVTRQFFGLLRLTGAKNATKMWSLRPTSHIIFFAHNIDIKR